MAGDDCFLVAMKDGRVRAMMRVDGDDCASVASTLAEWHSTDPTRRLAIMNTAELEALDRAEAPTLPLARGGA